jgi:hypothetical protein
MGYFRDAGEVYECIGGAFRVAGAAPEMGGALRAANMTVQLSHSEPSAELTVRFCEPYEVIDGGKGDAPDLTVTMSGDMAHRYWRGEFDLPNGLLRGEVMALGPISKLLRLVLITEPLMPLYRQITDERDRARGSADQRARSEPPATRPVES